MQIDLLYGNGITPCVRAVNFFDFFIIKTMFGEVNAANENLSDRAQEALKAVESLYTIVYGGLE